MSKAPCWLLVTCFAVSAYGEDLVFHKSRIYDSHGKEHKVDLAFADVNKALAIREKTTVRAMISYDAIGKVSYSYASRHRVREGAGEASLASAAWCSPYPYCEIVGVPLAVAGLGVGTGTMFSKEKKHWLDIDYHSPSGVPQTAAIRLDKSEYEKVLAAVKAATGKDVEMLPEEGKQKNKKSDSDKKQS